MHGYVAKRRDRYYAVIYEGHDPNGRPEGLPLQGFSMVAGVGFEPTTFGL